MNEQINFFWREIYKSINEQIISIRTKQFSAINKFAQLDKIPIKRLRKMNTTKNICFFSNNRNAIDI